MRHVILSCILALQLCALAGDVEIVGRDGVENIGTEVARLSSKYPLKRPVVVLVDRVDGFYLRRTAESVAFIYVDAALPKARQIVVVRHEWQHAIDDELGIHDWRVTEARAKRAEDGKLDTTKPKE